MQELIPPEDQLRTAQATADALRGGPRYDVEYRVVRPNGEVRLSTAGPCVALVVRHDSLLTFAAAGALAGPEHAIAVGLLRVRDGGRYLPASARAERGRRIENFLR